MCSSHMRLCVCVCVHLYHLILTWPKRRIQSLTVASDFSLTNTFLVQLSTAFVSTYKVWEEKGNRAAYIILSLSLSLFISFYFYLFRGNTSINQFYFSLSQHCASADHTVSRGKVV